MNEKHLLYWVFRYLSEAAISSDRCDPLEEMTRRIDAEFDDLPAWVRPSLIERVDEFKRVLKPASSQVDAAP